ncbi:MAG: class I SAM-dependent methyltransferase [Actinobacteria bacterium]|nr:class I SAM-dependent methyltransferase [Actinomycetota bacterium]
MAQNIYDDESFFAGYSTLPRSVQGLGGAPEWSTLRNLLPSTAERRIVDLGCGFGWFCRWAVENGAASVLGIDLSERMLSRARADTRAGNVVYEQQDLDRLALAPAAFDVAYSALTLHYLTDLSHFLGALAGALVPGGVFVFSVEHPIFTAPTNPAFVAADDGTVVWPLDGYLAEGERVTEWFAPGVIKQHRTIATYVSALIAAAFAIDDLVEWGPTAEQIAAVPDWAAERERPPFLLIRAHRQ